MTLFFYRKAMLHRSIIGLSKHQEVTSLRKFLIFITLLALFCSITLLSWLYLTKSHTEHPHTVETLKIQYKEPQHFTGIQSPSQLTNIFFDSNKGIIHNWFVKNEEHVKKNQPLFEYYNVDIEHQITSKQKYLAHLNNIDPLKYPTISLERNRTQHEIETLQTQLRTTIYASMDGQIAINQRVPSQNNGLILQIFNPSAIIKAKVPESIVNTLELKDKVHICIDPGHSFTGTVSFISKLPLNTEANTKSSQYHVEISSTPDIKFGRHLRVEKPNYTIEIPKTAIYKKQFVFLQRNKKFIKRVIKTEKLGNNKDMKVIEGLNIGDTIAKNANHVLSKN